MSEGRETGADWQAVLDYAEATIGWSDAPDDTEENFWMVRAAKLEPAARAAILRLRKTAA